MTLSFSTCTTAFRILQFNMVAERANRSRGRFGQQSAREGSEQADLPQEQQQSSEHKLPRQKFRKVSNRDSRDIQNKFNYIQELNVEHEFRGTVGPVPPKTDHLGFQRAQCKQTSPTSLPMKSSDYNGLASSARTVPGNLGSRPEVVSVCSEVNKTFFENRFQKMSNFNNMKYDKFPKSTTSLQTKSLYKVQDNVKDKFNNRLEMIVFVTMNNKL